MTLSVMQIRPIQTRSFARVPVAHAVKTSIVVVAVDVAAVDDAEDWLQYRHPRHRRWDRDQRIRELVLLAPQQRKSGLLGSLGGCSLDHWHERC